MKEGHASSIHIPAQSKRLQNSTIGIGHKLNIAFVKI